jgi:Uma2 family endonuclease
VGAQSIPKPLTVEEYERIPDPPGGRYELHQGEAVIVTYPLHNHKELQRRLRKPLEPLAEAAGFVVDTEFPYRPFPENEVWGADLACVGVARYDAIEKCLVGSPEMVIEVKSASNTKAEMHDKAMTTSAGEGAVEFWIVDLATKTVTVHSTLRGMRVYGEDSAVPVPLFDGSVDLSQLFAGL